MPPDDDMPPLYDSPWFWACMFLTAALIALVVMEPRFEARQAQIEQQYFARQQHGQSIKPESEPQEASQPGDTLINLRPLYIAAWIGLAAVWAVFLWTRRRGAKAEPLRSAHPAEEPPSAEV
jgi:hypothetical protein